MAKRTYIPTLLTIATRMCQVIVRATPVIQREYPSNTALQAALVAANAACQVLAAEASAVREYGD